MHEVTAVEPLEGYRLRVTFDDGAEGIVDVGALTRFQGVFEPLQDPVRFQQVRVHREFGTVCWPSGADLDPDVLHAMATGRPTGIQASTGTT